MKVVFISNFYNHHQKPLADTLYAMIGDDYHFIETAPITKERLAMGWGKDERPPYILRSYLSEFSRAHCQTIIDEADVVVYGSAPYAMVKPRLKKGRLTFMYTERIYKKGIPYFRLPLHILRALNRYVKYKNFYVLCASAYTPLDFSKVFAFLGKTYKWGYFPAVKRYGNIDQIIEQKDPASILWVARLIELKHPELPVEIAKRLKTEGYDFKLNMIGNGPLEEQIQKRIATEGLSGCVEMLGAMSPECVREYMEKSEIFLFTSDKNEGWGAVLNESMNSACAVVASQAIGSVPFLINNGENGYMYQDGNADDLYDKVKKLLEDDVARRQIGKNAYITMKDEWNAENAAKKLLALSEKLLSGNKSVLYADGVCSKADILHEDFI